MLKKKKIPNTTWKVLEKQKLKKQYCLGHTEQYGSLAKLIYLLVTAIPNLVFIVLQIL